MLSMLSAALGDSMFAYQLQLLVMLASGRGFGSLGVCSSWAVCLHHSYNCWWCLHPYTCQVPSGILV